MNKQDIIKIKSSSIAALVTSIIALISLIIIILNYKVEYETAGVCSDMKGLSWIFNCIDSVSIRNLILFMLLVSSIPISLSCLYSFVLSDYKDIDSVKLIKYRKYVKISKNILKVYGLIIVLTIIFYIII